jgi:hypothetical protein
MASEFRKKLVSDIWHFCANCSRWPTERYVATFHQPEHQSICLECRAKYQRGECTSELHKREERLGPLRKPGNL